MRRDPSRSPFFNVTFNLESGELHQSLPGLDITLETVGVPYRSPVGTAMFELYLNAAERKSGEIFVQCDHNADLIAPETLQRWLHHYRTLLQGIVADPKVVAAAVLPLTPGTSAGNSLEVLNRRYERGGTLAYLRDMPSLIVFNDEAHHIHEVRNEGEITEVEWQKSLRAIAETKGSQFVQIDFSATPYNQVGSGVKAKAVYFPHIIADFDLRDAMRAGLVKSLVLDKRRELGALSNDELQFKADRDEHGRPILSEGQRIMVRAGFAKLLKLEKEFATIDPSKHPKMLVVCEDTTVTPLVARVLTVRRSRALSTSGTICKFSMPEASTGSSQAGCQSPEVDVYMIPPGFSV